LKFSHLYPQNATIFIRDISINHNKNFVDVQNYSVHNNEITGFSLNLTADLKQNITKALVYVKIKIPEDADDGKFQKELLRTVVDAEKVLKASKTNFLVAKIVEGFVSSSSRELKIPLQKV
jgi:hypothetical protein